MHNPHSVVQRVVRIVEWCWNFGESVLAHPPEVGKDQGLLRRSGQQVEINFLAIELSFVESGHDAHCGSTGSTGQSEINWQNGGENGSWNARNELCAGQP